MAPKQEYQLDVVMNREDPDNLYTDTIDTEPITLGSGRDIINYLLKNDLDLSGLKLIKRKGR